MSKFKISDTDLITIVQVYNAEGKAAAYNLIRNQYEVKHPYNILKRIRKHPNFKYNRNEDSYDINNKEDSAEMFLSMEDLCSPMVTKNKPSLDNSLPNNRISEMEKLIQELLGERLLELNKYISLDSSTKTMMIDHTSLSSAGYQVISY